MAKTKQARLPGTEDPAIQELEDAAIEHSDLLAEIRTKRDEIKEIDKRIARLMKENGKNSYTHLGIELKLRRSEETVSVKVKRHEKKEEDEEAA